MSAPQVRRGLFDGTRQWERYREQMAPVLPVLDPWVRKFGYGEFIHLEHRNCKACMMKGDKLFREVADPGIGKIVEGAWCVA